MSKEQKLEVIRQACIKANPEIVELKEGCVVLVGENKLPHTVYAKDEGIYSAFLNKPFPKDLEYNDFYDCEFSDAASVEIVGRPIRFADVLLAMKQLVVVNHKGEITAINAFGNGEDESAIWNLRNDDLTQQSEETINFLYDLLK